MGKIQVNKPSDKAVRMREKLSVERVAPYIDKIRDFYHDVYMDISDECKDPEVIIQRLEHAFEEFPLLLENMSETAFGMGYLLGTTMAVIEGDLEDDEFESE